MIEDLRSIVAPVLLWIAIFIFFIWSQMSVLPAAGMSLLVTLVFCALK